MTWSHVGCMPLGPQHQPTPGPGVDMLSGCDFVTFFDAQTAQYLFAIVGPPVP